MTLKIKLFSHLGSELMYIQKVSLTGYRNLKDITLFLKNGVNIFYGENAQGKTNFLEALYLCASGRSLRTKNDSQLIEFKSKESHIQMLIQKQNSIDKIDIHLKKEAKKGIAVNGIPLKKLGELFGTCHAVIFSPEDLNLVKNGPIERRRFMDMEICQMNVVYYYNLQKYYKILKQRNHLLKEIQKKPFLKDTLFVWDKQLVDTGKRIIDARSDFLSELNKIASEKQNRLTGGKDALEIIYKPNSTTQLLEQKLIKNHQRDILLGTTQSGPHKDDILFLINGRDVKQYGSQGQQRTTALSAKLAEIDLIEQQTAQKPILLLDDVLSELDKSRQNFLMESIGHLQTVLTCTGIEDAIKGYVKQAYLFHVEKGEIKKIK